MGLPGWGNLNDGEVPAAKGPGAGAQVDGRGAGLMGAAWARDYNPRLGTWMKDNWERGENHTKGMLFFEPKAHLKKMVKSLWLIEYFKNSYMF